MTYAKREGFVSRSEAGLAQPDSRSTNITPGRGGCVWHWIGVKQNITSHSQCAGVWRSIQNHHMNTNGWVDVAYTFGVCPHGYIFAGRGALVRTAANGTNEGNQYYYAICAFLGPGNSPSEKMMMAILSGTLELRREGGAGDRILPHGDLTGSSCPGPDLSPAARDWDNRDIPTGDDETDFEEWWNEMDEKKQKVIEALADQILADGPKGQPEDRDVTPDSLGRSFARQSYIMLRDDRKWIAELDRLVGLKSAGGVAQTSLQGIVIGAVNAIDAVRDQGYDVITTERTGPRRT